MSVHRVWPLCLILVSCFARLDDDDDHERHHDHDSDAGSPSDSSGSPTSSRARSRSEFCRSWAQSACNSEVVSACQAKDATACRLSQESFCLALVPDEFSAARSGACLGAVSSAYRDADLHGEELAVVLRLGGACAQLIQHPDDVGRECVVPSDCDLSVGHACVKKADSGTGTCQVAKVAEAGRSCAEPAETCEPGFFCDGQNCIETLPIDAECTITEQCSEGGYCDEDGQCTALRAVDEACEDDAQCASGVCLDLEGQTVCTDRIVLTRSEPICANLR
jgi:hypothetical protein